MEPPPVGGGCPGPGDTDTGQLPSFRRSVSHQDVFGRVIPDQTNLPPDLERLNLPHARSIDNIAALGSTSSGQYPPVPTYTNGQPMNALDALKQINNNGRMRMPFPPVPKLDQIPLPISSSMSTPATQASYAAVSGFGSVTSAETLYSQAGMYPPGPVPTQVYPGQDGDQGWRIPQYKKRSTDQVIPTMSSVYPPPNNPVAWVKTDMGPPPPPPPHQPHHGHLQQLYQSLGQLPGNQGGRMVWNSRENR